MIGTLRLGNLRRWSELKPTADEVVVNICRPWPLSNPHPVQSPLMIDRELSISLFKEDLENDFRTSGPMAQEVYRIVDILKSGRNVILMCWCAPKACHGDVIKDKVQQLLKAFEFQYPAALKGSNY